MPHAALPTADGLFIGPWDLRLGQGGGAKRFSRALGAGWIAISDQRSALAAVLAEVIDAARR